VSRSGLDAPGFARAPNLVIFNGLFALALSSHRSSLVKLFRSLLSGQVSHEFKAA
jgi:hypothetical protein